MNTWQRRSRHLETFVSVVAERQTYRNLAYLLLAIPLGFAYYVGMLFGFVLGIILVLAIVGIPLVVLSLIGSRYVVDFERRLTNALLATEIEAPNDVPSVSDDGIISTVVGLIRAESTWRGLGFLVLKSVIAFVAFLFLFIAGFTALALTLAPLSSSVEIWEVWTIETRWESALAVPIGVVVGVLVLHAINAIADITSTIAVALLGTAHGSANAESVSANGDGQKPGKP
ncbi:sensor domain-containing protein [Natronosalvus vescus]|uniref:sensor domain-containing protein n=1 Tax=Natronosalvus vescus TaxID=2953881 RepID=UPI002090D96E|nr:sensor domain-containing protein [Natronosalvus vescus]